MAKTNSTLEEGNGNEWKESFWNIFPFPCLEVLMEGMESLFPYLGV